ncbi:MAG: cupin domain-containing protein [Sphingomicrobium sp.]
MLDIKKLIAVVCTMAGVIATQHATAAGDAAVTPLIEKSFNNLPGKEGLMILVEYPPGSVDPVHRHDAHGFIYVLEGSVVMGVKGGKEQTLTSGQTFYEGPEDIHTVGRNASATTPAKLLVFLVKEKKKPVLIPVK